MSYNEKGAFWPLFFRKSNDVERYGPWSFKLLIDLHVGFTISVEKDMDSLFLKNEMVLAVQQGPRMRPRARIYKFLPPSSASFVSS